MQPWLGRGGGGRGLGGAALRLGRPGSARRGLRGGLRRFPAGGPRRRGEQLHHRPPPGAGRRGRRAGATRWSCRRSRSWPRRTHRPTSARRPSSPTSTLTTGNLTPDTIATVVTARTRAVIAVDQGGVPARPPRPARAGATRAGSSSSRTPRAPQARPTHRRPVGAEAEIAAWSFHPRKLLTTGEGGMLTTSRTDWADRARTLREHAMSVSAARPPRVGARARRSPTPRSASTSG